MKKYVVNISEICIKTIIIEAEDKYEAFDKACNMWNNEKIILDYNNFDHMDCEVEREANDADINNFEEV